MPTTEANIARLHPCPLGITFATLFLMLASLASALPYKQSSRKCILLENDLLPGYLEHPIEVFVGH
ncbi:MAG: hypothetical protein K5821_15930 [Nitrobacter sp.]|uniref:hypothetical protein n=1 Tax=Nitrobacter sp. TaxID=29420 RepID=UPI002601F302|nr:hypothetical protein [Nitrobacter sp.]MCV0387858.1 hypothetical protein [Nitrobacter sp.]